MAKLIEGKLQFDFPANWSAIKFDESWWFKHQIQPNIKGVDILASQQINGHTKQHWLIEIKDCAGYEAANEIRLSPENTEDLKTKLETSRDWLKAQNYNDEIKISRKKQYIIDEVLAKMRDTLVSLQFAERAAHAPLAAFIPKKNESIHIVLFLTWNIPDYRRFALRLQQKLNTAMAAYGLQGFVCDGSTLPQTLHCTVSRITT